MAISTVLGVWLVMIGMPGIPIAWWLRHHLVERPAAWCNRIHRGHVLLAMFLLSFTGLMLWQLEGDGVRLLSMMAPDIIGFLTMVEVSAYLDTLVAVIALSSAVRMSGVRAWIVTIVPQRSANKPRARARHRRSPRAIADNDDEDIGELGCAIAA